MEYKNSRGKPVLVLSRTVAAMVRERGMATADDLYPMFEGYTRQQVIKALQNAKTLGWLESDGHQPRRGKGAGSGGVCTTYRVKVSEAQAVANRRPVSSVFQLGELV